MVAAATAVQSLQFEHMYRMSQVASITRFGSVNPILFGPDGVIIAGHARLLVALQLGMSDVPVIVLGHLLEAERCALLIADNQLALNAHDCRANAMATPLPRAGGLS
jgi:ParB-like chromosome segregation protein Spo0J